MTAAADRLLTVVIDLLVRDGFEGVSVRRVASAAGVSIGAVQHHFPTKNAMLTAAMDRAGEHFQERLRSRLTSTDPAAAEALRAVAEELLAADDESRPTSVLWIVQVARAAIDDETAARHGHEWQQVEDLLAALIEGSRPGQDQDWVRERAAGLLALLDGLAVSQVVEPARMPAERARRLLDDALDAILRA